MFRDTVTPTETDCEEVDWIQLAHNS